MKAELAIVILNWNGVALLERFLPSVIEFSEDAAIYVIDNGSTDDSLALLADRFSQVTIIALEKNFGFAGGYNIGLAQITEPYLCLLNSDVRVEKGWITDPLRLLKQVKVGIVQPKILDEKRPEFFEYAGAAGGLLDKLGYPYCRGRRFQSVEKDQGQYEEPCSIFWAT
ncbi:MAG: glycosyltransferase, partial [Bacteroidetes bacterium]|nr:glycosyltransferase [Bacteroidota bacterium]